MRYSYYITNILLCLSLPETVQSRYTAAKAEQYAIETRNENTDSGCAIWKNNDSPIKDDLHAWKTELFWYNEKLRERTEFAPDVRTLFNEDGSNKDQVCRDYADPPAVLVAPPAAVDGSVSDPKTIQVKPFLRKLRRLTDGSVDLRYEFFGKSQQLSHDDKLGYMEPLLPPLRHHQFCEGDTTAGMGWLDFIIHDFGHMCRRTLNKTSQTVFVDLGATYNFNGDGVDTDSPAIRMIEQYRRFGIHFDHIYAYEIRDWDVDTVYNSVPEHMRGPLHWINVAIEADPSSQNNPHRMLLEQFGPDDFVVIKLDIDTPAIENPLLEQLLTDPKLQEIVDVFYFEHHVEMEEMKPYWGEMDKSIVESLEVFQKLRKAGIAAHYWI